MDRIIYFFGYGAYKNKERVNLILKRQPKGYGAVIENYALHIQALEQVPSPVRERLNKVWGPNFRSYTMRTNPGSMVLGIVWEITEKDFETIRQWEFIGVWREFIQVQVKLFDGRVISAMTEKIPDNHPINEEVDGLDYVDNLNWAPPQFDDKEVEKEYKLDDLRKELEQIKPSDNLPAKE